ncbi:MAG TPA: branched-chain amino acid ABC transporter permease [Geminicoccus sp.]|jgi:branched-chain amino acid transport system permease protein|uniref:branched-chain amino acid ABC transporter permease n=1 Tax=Geminicoccus sp. TaxID=2024832 RepID=UPI002E2F2AA6|nr:branched-chain amino acid ABC transporter permease [Geminicoccus sp.]HEX2528223.1 branched-chain amino acid ABC transporter permease [Geminicoccus sp.]
MTETPIRRILPLLLLLAVVAAVAALVTLVGGDEAQLTVTEALIRLTVVVGISIFIGNSGVVSFGHIGFMCIAAYAAAWATCNPMWKQLMLTGLPMFLQENQYPFLAAVGGGAVLAAAVALVFGAVILRLSGIAASIATFAFLAIVNNVYSNWDTVTAGVSSIIGIPTVVDPWIGLAFALIAIVLAFWFKNSRMGLMLRATRDDPVAARASGVSIVRVRLAAFVLSAFVVGLGGTLYAQFLGVVTVDMFYLQLTFVTLAMLIIGGMGSITGAVVGVFAVTVFVEFFRYLEAGVTVGESVFGLPEGSQEIALGVGMALILIFMPQGLTRSKELKLPRSKGRPVPAALTARELPAGS